jgi:5-methylcytosine-specific restriction endonuclease McrA
MTTSFESLGNLSEQELLDHFAGLVTRDRRTTAELLVAIAEIDERKVWAAQACSSMFTFCMERFHMSEQMTAKRLWAARTARRYPVVLDMVARGELHLGAIHLLAKHLTEENHARVLERAKHRSCREVERLVAELAPRADVPARIRALPVARGAGPAVDGSAAAALVDSASSNQASSSRCARPAVDGPVTSAFEDGRLSDELSTCADPTGCTNDARRPGTPGSRPAAKPIVPLSPRRYKIEITVDEATHDKLRSLQDLLARSGTGRDPAAIISRAIEDLLARTLARRAACTDRPKTVKSAMRAVSAMPAESEIRAESAMPVRTEPRDRSDPARDVAASGLEKRNRSIPAVVRREVWRRDSGRCCYVDVRGRRCGETSNVEFHHKFPFALSGLSTTGNIELRCAAHNQFQADLDFGRSFMDARRGKAATA